MSLFLRLRDVHVLIPRPFTTLKADDVHVVARAYGKSERTYSTLLRDCVLFVVFFLRFVGASLPTELRAWFTTPVTGYQP